MKIYKLTNTIILLTLLSTLSQANSDGIYIGVGSSIMDVGDDSLKVENKDKTKSTYHDISGPFHSIKVGYQHFDKNRVELYFRGHQMEAKEGDFNTKSVGINYEWGFTSLASEKLMPYVSLGLGAGEISSSDLKAIDKADMGEIIFGIGVRYQITENIDAQLAYNHTGMIIDNFHDEETDEVSSLCQRNVMLGFNYKF